MIKNVLATGAIFIAIALLVVLFLHPNRPIIGTLPEQKGEVSIKGIVRTLNDTQDMLTLVTSNGSEIQVALNESTKVRNNIGRGVAIATIQPGMEVNVIGLAPNSISLTASSILIAHDVRDNWGIKPDTLFDNSLIPTSYTITGLANGDWFRKGYFFTRVMDAHNETLMRTRVYPQSAATTTEFRPFTAWLSFEVPKSATGTIAFERVGDGEEIVEQIFVPVRFTVQAGTLPVKLYYQNTRKAELAGDACGAESLSPVIRNIPDTKSPIHDTISKLITGIITDEERQHGFTTTFPLPEFRLATSTLAPNGLLTLEFTKAAGFTIGDTCRAKLLAAQIELTAKQFKSVKFVALEPIELFQP
jgi:hypothetical protein